MQTLSRLHSSVRLATDVASRQQCVFIVFKYIGLCAWNVLGCVYIHIHLAIDVASRQQCVDKGFIVFKYIVHGMCCTYTNEWVQCSHHLLAVFYWYNIISNQYHNHCCIQKKM